MNFAIIGCGVIGRSTARCFDKLPEDRLVAVFDRRSGRADALAKELRVRKVHTDYEEVLRDPQVEAVVICTASHVHAEQAVMAIEAGKHVACEKPLDVTADRELDIIKAARERGVKVQCLYQRRCIPEVRAAREAITGGAIGDICLAEARLKYYRDQHYYDEAPWRGVSGGVVLNQGIHGIDMILWMLGKRVLDVKSVKGTLGHKTDAEDTAAAIVTLEGGGILTVAATTCAVGEDRTEFCVHGTKGTIAFDINGQSRWVRADGEGIGPETTRVYEEAAEIMSPRWDNDYHAWLLRDLALAVEQGREPFIPPEEVLESTRLAQLILG